MPCLLSVREALGDANYLGRQSLSVTVSQYSGCPDDDDCLHDDDDDDDSDNSYTTLNLMSRVITVLHYH